ncbi:STAS/SEC14 domain-containing protein [Polyangium sp. 15x6]|uniref:STAS/SEC14 domain-containing protein n=1 Tax=Polyangium sp. 15x6 TaxID=3042687 RepID=UPI00249A5860|nr:STAS/SEC14 domain-containing protein [Polyangium sp. 15x6]MDI3287149.1 STAS/SEC14 domain-containing protein [Polyangium sp. 15x6]
MRPDLPTNALGSEGWYRTGGHTYRCEDAGIVFIRLGGDLAEDDVAAFFDAFARLCDERGLAHVFWLIDIGRLGAVLPGARTRAATTPVRRENKGMVLFNGSFKQRVLVRLVDKATSLLQPKVPPLVFFSAEAEARAWIDARRRELGMRDDP